VGSEELAIATIPERMRKTHLFLVIYMEEKDDQVELLFD
jgi:hypothetical protein